jgi:hypothetical protein
VLYSLSTRSPAVWTGTAESARAIHGPGTLENEMRLLASGDVLALADSYRDVVRRAAAEYVDMNEPCNGFSFIARPHSRLMINWIVSARRTESSEGVVTASSKALVCNEFGLS